jgi:hypothetical protein
MQQTAPNPTARCDESCEYHVIATSSSTIIIGIANLGYISILQASKSYK